jgi:hypothetical protein
MIDDDGSGLTGTIIDNPWKTELYNQIDGADAAVTSAYQAADTAVTNSVTSGYQTGDNNIMARVNQISPAYGQIQFPAAQSPSSNPNMLDDYEEGTWSPTDQSGAGLVFGSVQAEYVKIGRHVAASCSFLYPATASAALVTLGGLPYACDATQMWGGSRTYGPYGGAPIMFMVLQSSANMFVSTAAGQSKNSDFTSQIMNFFVVYMTGL